MSISSRKTNIAFVSSFPINKVWNPNSVVRNVSVKYVKQIRPIKYMQKMESICSVDPYSFFSLTVTLTIEAPNGANGTNSLCAQGNRIGYLICSEKIEGNVSKSDV